MEANEEMQEVCDTVQVRNFLHWARSNPMRLQQKRDSADGLTGLIKDSRSS